MFIRGIDRYSRHFVVLHGFSRCALLHPCLRKSFNYFKSFYVQDRSCALAFRLPLYFYSLIGKGIHSRVNSTVNFFFDFYSSYTLTVDCNGCQELYYSMLTFEFKDIRYLRHHWSIKEIFSFFLLHIYYIKFFNRSQIFDI